MTPSALSNFEIGKLLKSSKPLASKKTFNPSLDKGGQKSPFHVDMITQAIKEKSEMIKRFGTVRHSKNYSMKKGILEKLSTPMTPVQQSQFVFSSTRQSTVQESGALIQGSGLQLKRTLKS